MLQAGHLRVNPGSQAPLKHIPAYTFQAMTFKTLKGTVCLRLPDGRGETTGRPERARPRFAAGEKALELFISLLNQDLYES
jgi:hypothetical protein